MPGSDTIVIYKGEDVTLPFTMNPVEDITGWTLEMNARRGDQVKITAAAVVVDGPTGKFSVTLTDSETDPLEHDYIYDIWRTDTDSETVLARGIFIVRSVARTVV